MNINGQCYVKTVKIRIREELGIDVLILEAKNKKPAPETVRFASLYPSGKFPKSNEFKPNKSLLVKNFEQNFKEIYGVTIKVLGPEGDPANQDDTYGSIYRRYALASGERPPLAEWLNNGMMERRLGPEELAKISGVNLNTLTNILFGKTHNPQSQTIHKLEETLNEKVPEEIKQEVKEDADAGFGELIDFDPWAKHGDAVAPSVAGVYILYDRCERPVYVGKSETSIRARIRSHSEKKWFISPIVMKAAYVHITDLKTISKLEKLLIKFLKSNALINEQLVDR